MKHKFFMAMALAISACTAADAETPAIPDGVRIPVTAQENRIAPDAPEIIVEGARHLSCTDGTMTINRFSDEMWDREDLNNFAPKKANTQSGVRIIFKTDSRTVKPVFTERTDADLRVTTNFYGIYKNGTFTGNVRGDGLVLTSDGSITEWEIALPIFYGVDFGGLILDDGAKLYKVERSDRPVYAAIGDSITHGAGQSQCGSNGSYPGVLADTNGYLLYNFAVGGSQISPAIAGELEGLDVDIITVLWGYNDWNGLKGDIEEITRRYTSLVSELRRVQPDARIYFIMPTICTNEDGTSGKRAPGCPLDDVRNAERSIVQAAIDAGDRNMFIIEGKELTSTDLLKGGVHFTNDGAARFGKALAGIVR